MKKSILLMSAVLFTASVFAYANWNKKNLNENSANCVLVGNESETPPTLFMPKPVEIYYDLGTRFGAMKKSTLHQITSIRDFFTEHVNDEIFAIESANIIVIKHDKHTNTQEANEGDKLTTAQLQLLQNCAYSTHLKISTDVKTKTGYGYYTPHLTIVPEKQAKYSLGKEAFIEYLKEGNKENTYNVKDSKLGFAKLNFTVDKNGKLTNITLDLTSGYKNIDNAINELLRNAPGRWIPAQNAEGENVPQELVISFGKAGC